MSKACGKLESQKERPDSRALPIYESEKREGKRSDKTQQAGFRRVRRAGAGIQGLKRLGLEGRVSRRERPDKMIPAAGQGIMVVQGRAGEDYSWLSCVDDKAARGETAEAERAFVTYLDGD